MPAITILIDTDPGNNTTTVDAWAIGTDGKPLPIAQSYDQIVNDPSCGAVARAMLFTAQAMFTGGHQVQTGRGVPAELHVTLNPIVPATPNQVPAITSQMPA